MHQGATAHGAGLERDEQFALWQTIVTQHLCGFSQCQHLRMRCRVVQRYLAVTLKRNHLIVANNDRADRHFT